MYSLLTAQIFKLVSPIWQLVFVGSALAGLAGASLMSRKRRLRQWRSGQPFSVGGGVDPW